MLHMPLLAALILALLAVLLLAAAWAAFGRRRGRAPAQAAQAAPTVPNAPAPSAAPPASAAPYASAAQYASSAPSAAPPRAYTPPAAPTAAAPTAVPEPGVAYLTLGGAARIYPLRDAVCVIGRDPGCQVEVPAEFGSVSRRHAQIERSGGDYILADLASANGVWVNDARVGRNLLRDGTVFSLGKQVACTFHRNA